MRIFIFLSLVLILFSNATPVESKTVRSRGTRRKQRRVQVRTNFESFFRIIYVANELGTQDLAVAADTLAFTYNGKFLPRFSNDEQQNVTIDYNDPFERRMETVEVLEVVSRRNLGEEETRNLQFSSQLRNLSVFLRVTGSCLGCPIGTRFTNQVQRRRHLSSKSGKGKGATSYDSTTAPDIPPRDDGSAGSLPVPTVVPVDPADLPTEEELRIVYRQEIQLKNLNIVDVMSLDEVDE